MATSRSDARSGGVVESGAGMQVVRLVRDGAVEAESVGDFVSSESGVVAAVALEVGQLRAGKIHCEKCGFDVNPEGHNLRCRTPTKISADAEIFAWLGDAAWEVVVRHWVVYSDMPRGASQQYTLNEALARFLDSGGRVVRCGVVVNDISSSHSKGTLVEASYALSAEVRFALAHYFGIPFLHLFEGLLKPVLGKHYDRRVANYIDSRIDGYCYMRLLGLKEQYLAARLGRYPLLSDVLPLVKDRLAVRDWYVAYGSDFVHLFDGPHPAATKLVCSAQGLLVDPKLRVGGGKVCDVSDLLVSNVLDGSWPQDLHQEHYRLVNLLKLYHFVGGPYHAFATQRVFDQLSVFLSPVPTGVATLKHLKLLRSCVAAANAALPLTGVVSGGYIATSGVLAFQSVACVEESHL